MIIVYNYSGHDQRGKGTTPRSSCRLRAREREERERKERERGESERKRERVSKRVTERVYAASGDGGLGYEPPVCPLPPLIVSTIVVYDNQNTTMIT